MEWTELGGDEAETVLANLIYSEHPTATRVRPSRGDFGLDVLNPSKGEPAKYDNYQIKKYAKTLTQRQKRDVEDSFRRVLIGMVRREPRKVPLADWYLVAPVDLTVDKMLDWFDAMPDAVIADMFANEKLALTGAEKQEIRAWKSAPGRIIKWEGRSFCETMAGKYRHVIDYYLHGGEEQLRHAVAEMTAILLRDTTLPAPTAASDTAALVTPAELIPHLHRVFNALDTDPHYRYEFSLDLAPREITRQEGMVAATQMTVPDGQTLTFRVYRRFAEAENERPIPFKLMFAADDADFDLEAYDSWRKYGTPLTAPAEVDIDLPGGLGAPLAGGLTEVSVEAVGQTYQVRLRIRKPDGSAGEPMLFTITAKTGPEGTGVWESGTDESGYLTFETKTDLETHAGTWGFKRPRIVGQQIDSVLPIIEFMQDVAAPNTLQIAQTIGPFIDYRDIPSREPAFPESVMNYLRALSIIQGATTTPVLIPDLSEVTPEEALAVIEAAKLLTGQTVFSQWDEARFLPEATPEVGADLSARQVDLDDHYEIKIVEPLIVKVGDAEYTLCAVERRLLSVHYELDETGTIVARPLLNDTAYTVIAPGEPIPDRNFRPVQGRLIGKIAEALAEQQREDSEEGKQQGKDSE
ncbi:hypothetical protein [Mycobacterium sp.]|uniref:hypothetical protein n=1 Tax=Mycobacterium sp. TaxID=1785 RepID=UPI003F9AC88D